MNFRKHGSNLGLSECGNYEIRVSTHHGIGKEFYNAYHIPTDKHIAAGFKKAEVKQHCENHAAKLAAQKTEAA